MIQLERQRTILRYLEEHQTASIRDLSDAIFSSEASIRRDVQALEAQGLVTHVFGGVMLNRFKNTPQPVEIRENSNTEVKDLLAKQAASLIQNGDTILMDSSSTVRRITNYLGNLNDIKIITNNLRLIYESNLPNVRFYCSGGTYEPRDQHFVGSSAINFLNNISADILFFSARGIDEDGTISDVSEELCDLRHVMMTRARKKVFLADSNKFNQRKIFSLCNLSEVDQVITDATDWMESHNFKK